MRVVSRDYSREYAPSLWYIRLDKGGTHLRMDTERYHDIPSGALTAREVCQVLREVVLGRRTMTKVGKQSWEQLYACHFEVDVEGWRITIYNDCDELDYCDRCVSPEGKRWDFDPGDRTDPVALLSTWEHQTLESMLKAQ